jgi:hypothetical protein
MSRFPWFGPFLAAVLHLPVTFAWAVVTAHGGHWALLGWQAVGWPLLFLMLLFTMSPLLRLLERRRLPLPGNRRALLALGLCFNAAGTLTLLMGPPDAATTAGAWCLGFVAAAAFERWRAAPPAALVVAGDRA